MKQKRKTLIFHLPYDIDWITQDLRNEMNHILGKSPPRDYNA